MSLTAGQADFINYRALLKGNYRKGVHALREILNSPDQASDFISNSGALAIVLGHDPAYDDQNSAELRKLMRQSTYMEAAVTNWLPILFPGKTPEQITGDADMAAAIAASGAASFSVANADKWGARTVATLAGLDPDQYQTIASLVNDDSAVAAIKASPVATKMAKNNPKLLGLFPLTDDDIATLLDQYESGDDSAADTIVSNTDAVKKVLTKPEWNNVLKGYSAYVQKVASMYAGSKDVLSTAIIISAADVAKSNTSLFSGWVGNSFNVSISGKGTHKFKIAGVGVDSGSTFTCICDDIIETHAMNSSDTASGGWEKSSMRSYLSGTLFNAFPTELKSSIKSVPKKNTASYGAATTNDKLWLLSSTEVGFSDVSGEGSKYGIFTDDASRVRKLDGSADLWWLRSVYSSAYFRRMGYDGSLDDGYGGLASRTMGVVPGFCI